ncbi:MAG: ABC transporter permease [Acidobacteriota bacterium]|nr:MAG: ABC transporter permease [Acidobacteriota bacterium]
MSPFLEKHAGWKPALPGVLPGALPGALAVLLIVTGIVAPSFFDPSNLRDLAVANAPVLIVAIGMTLVIIAGQIDISVGSQFAVCGMLAGYLAKQDIPVPLLIFIAPLIGALLGGINGVFVARLGMPSIVVTLAMMVILRDSLRWITEGEWVQGMPGAFQWFGLGQSAGQLVIVLIALIILLIIRWILNNIMAGRAFYAVGSDPEAARLAGVDPRLITFLVFTLLGALTGLAALLNSIRFNSIPSNSGLGLELKAIAAVVVGGTAITGGRGSLVGTLLGVALLGTIGTALTYLGINPFWEKAIQGGIILLALLSESLLNGSFAVIPGLRREGAK